MASLLDSRLVIIGDDIFWNPKETLTLPHDGYAIDDSFLLCNEKKSSETIRAIPFSVYDGFAVKNILANVLNISSAVISQSSDFTEIIQRRCRDLKIPFCFTNIPHKPQYIARFCLKHRYSLHEIAIFDDQLTSSDFFEERPKILLSKRDFPNVTQHFIRTVIDTSADKNVDILSYYNETRMLQGNLPPSIRSVKKTIRALICDIDGTCTDGFKIYGEDGSEWKRFSFADMQALRKWNNCGHLSFLVTGESGPIPQKFAAQCHIPQAHLFTNADNKKLQILFEICQNFGIQLGEIAYIGDDMNDLGIIESLIRENGIAACPARAMPLIKNIPHIFHLRSTGGFGAVAEFVEIVNALER
jgi:3-deoxy-D-manno-octulosonate 8-phosphate phosphatase (KDO 8-P phosphatase)